jgi:hypothetical protein
VWVPPSRACRGRHDGHGVARADAWRPC